MNILLHPIVVFTLTGLALVAVCLDPVPIQFAKTPVLVASGTNAIFTIQTVSDASLIRWITPGNITLAMWTNGLPVLQQVPGYQGRISVTATQLTITNSQLSDSGTYSVSVEPSPSSGLGVNTQTIQLKVFDAVNGVTLSLPGVPQEGKNISLLCKWTAGTDVNVLWGKGGAALSSDTRITINGGSLVISPASRADSGEYTCTANNSVSARTASGSLSVYYGPDAPQLNKTSSQCVGGGDTTVGQTIRLTCTSASLPPASFSWELSGQPVTAGQSGSGVLSLQIFSTNQAGRYICTARNDITGATSTQQIDVAIVGTCLSGGAVAGIVIACFVALLIIIIIIIVLLRQRKVDQRVKEAFELQKANQNNGHMVSVPPLHDNNNPPVNENLNNTSSQNQRIFTTLPNNSNGNIHATAQNGLGNTNPLRNNGHLSTDAFQHNLSALSNNGHPNTHSNPNNSRSNPQPVQQNPNILIQTGNSQPGAPGPTVHVSLNTLPNTNQQTSAQPHTVHVNLNTYPQEASQPSHRQADPRESTLQRPHVNPDHRNPSQGGSPRSNNPARTGVDDALMNRSNQPSGLIQTSHSHPSNRTDTRRRLDNSQSSREEHPQRSNPTQMPWDLLRGTPAYPNPQVDSSDSDGSYERRPRSPRDARGARSGQRHRVAEPAGGVNQTASAAQGRDPQRSVAPNHSQIGPDVQNISTQLVSQNQVVPRQAVTQGRIPQSQNVMNLPQEATIPYHNEAHDHPRTHATNPQAKTGARADHTQTMPQQSIPLTQEALRQHTIQAENPFISRNQQTQAVLQNPGSPSRPSQPTQKLNKAGQKPPTPPPVLQPTEFKSLPRERVQQTRNLQPVHVIAHPVHVPHPHRSPIMHRQPQVWHTSPQRMPGIHPPMHAAIHGHPMHGHPMHVRQVHRGKPRR